MQDLKKTKKELEKVLEEKGNNLIRLWFDFHYATERLPKLEDNLKVANDAVVKIDGELAISKMPIRKERNKEEIVNLQTKQIELRNKARIAHEEVAKAKVDAVQSEMYIVEAEKLSTFLEECIKNPMVIYENKKNNGEKEDTDKK